MSTTPIILFTSNVPTVYRRSDIYDPAIHGVNPDNSGKLIPSVDALVVDDMTTDQTPTLLVVTAVDAITKASTLEPIRMADAVTSRVINYGNELLCLYYAESETLGRYRLTIDSKLHVFGEEDDAIYYVLSKRSDGVETIISNYVNDEGALDGYYVPLRDVDPSTGFSVFAECATTDTLTDGDRVYMKVYRASTPVGGGSTVYDLMTEITLVAKQAEQLSSLTIGNGAVTELEVIANQMDRDLNLVLYRGQALSELLITPKLKYANGHIDSMSIDDETVFAYGLTDVNNLLTGMQYEVLIKCAIPDSIPSTLLDPNGASRFITAVKTLIIKAQNVDAIMKISPIPYWDGSQWQLAFVGAPTSRVNQVYKLPPTDVTYVEDYAFDGTVIGTAQHVKAEYTQTDLEGNVVTYQQEFWITLFASATEPWWIVTDGIDGVSYGKTEETWVTPIVEVDGTDNTVRIPVASFAAWANVVSNFYTRATPPKFITESTAPTPTHFNLRYASTGVLINVNPIPSTEYTNTVTCTAATLLTDKTVIVEFLREVDDEMRFLYSVPVVVSDVT